MGRRKLRLVPGQVTSLPHAREAPPPSVTHLTEPPLLLQAVAALLLNSLPLAQDFSLWACESPTFSLSLVLFCSLFASESSEGFPNKLHFI